MIKHVVQYRARPPAPRGGHRLWCWFAVLALALLPGHLGAKEVIPSSPPRYFNDFANVVPRDRASQLNAELEQFERDTSNQIVVAVYPTMQSDSSIEDYATRVFEAWKIGQKGRSNGALLLVFTQSHRMRIQTGYGLEGALPDALCRRIMDNEIAPRLRSGDFAGGLAAGVHAMIAATKGEYQGTGSTVQETQRPGGSGGGGFPLLPAMFIGFVIIMMAIGRRRSRSTVFDNRGRTIISPPWWGPWGGGGSSSGGGGWTSSGGGGGGFSGGGGSSGGGGASGSW